MKKILLMMVVTIATTTSYGQAVIGTMGDCADDCHDCKDLLFKTSGQDRGVWKYNGCMIFGALSTAFDPSSVGSSGFTGVATYSETYFNNHQFTHFDQELRSSVYDYKGSDGYYNAGYYSYIRLCDGTTTANNDGMLLQGMMHPGYPNDSRPIIMQNEGGTVLIGTNSNNGMDKVQVNGTLQAKGYVANIGVKTANYSITNDDYTLLGDATSPGSITITLPNSSAVATGRIFVIKNIGTSGTVNAAFSGGIDASGTTSVAIGTPNHSLTFQFDGTMYRIIGSY